MGIFDRFRKKKDQSYRTDEKDEQIKTDVPAGITITGWSTVMFRMRMRLQIRSKILRIRKAEKYDH